MLEAASLVQGSASRCGLDVLEMFAQLVDLPSSVLCCGKWTHSRRRLDNNVFILPRPHYYPASGAL